MNTSKIQQSHNFRLLSPDAHGLIVRGRHHNLCGRVVVEVSNHGTVALEAIDHLPACHAPLFVPCMEWGWRLPNEANGKGRGGVRTERIPFSMFLYCDCTSTLLQFVYLEVTPSSLSRSVIQINQRNSVLTRTPGSAHARRCPPSCCSTRTFPTGPMPPAAGSIRRSTVPSKSGLAYCYPHAKEYSCVDNM